LLADSSTEQAAWVDSSTEKVLRVDSSIKKVPTTFLLVHCLRQHSDVQMHPLDLLSLPSFPSIGAVVVAVAVPDR